jgi:hypothetical protein
MSSAPAPERAVQPLKPRAFVAMMMIFSGLALPLTGIVNHLFGFAPPSVERHAWMSTHNALGALFTVSSVWHVVLNRRAAWNHARSAASRVPALSREVTLAAGAVAITLLIFVGHALHAGR